MYSSFLEIYQFINSQRDCNVIIIIFYELLLLAQKVGRITSWVETIFQLQRRQLIRYLIDGCFGENRRNIGTYSSSGTNSALGSVDSRERTTRARRNRILIGAFTGKLTPVWCNQKRCKEAIK